MLGETEKSSFLPTFTSPHPTLNPACAWCIRDTLGHIVIICIDVLHVFDLRWLRVIFFYPKDWETDSVFLDMFLGTAQNHSLPTQTPPEAQSSALYT